MKFLIILALLQAFQVCLASRILFLIPMPMKSHYALGDRLIRKLVGRGHHVTLISPFKMADPPKNFTEIVIPETSRLLTMMHQEVEEKPNGFSLKQMTPITFLLFNPLGKLLVNETLSSKGVQELMKSKQKFDLILAENFLNEGINCGFSHFYKAPLIGIGTFMPNIWSTSMVGNPSPFAYVPEPIIPYTSKMSFTERCFNFLYGVLANIIHYYKHLPLQDEMMRKYFGQDLPPIKDILSNTSLVLVNHHFSLAFPRPYLPNMVEVGSFHVKPPKPLPPNVQSFIDEAKEGAILFSMGSHLKSSEFPDEKLQGILKALSKLKQRVLWKFENENLPNIPPNVKILKWLPQSDVLAHPNVKLFITHGGVLSLTEATLRGVPIVGIPIFGDQPMNIRIVEELEIGVLLDYNDISEQTLLNAVNKVLSNPKYAKNIKYRSKLLQDVPISQIDNAIFWIEYVIRHKGAPHLRSPALDLAWYQLYLLDVYAFIASALAVSLFIIFKVLRCCKAVCRRNKENVSSKKKKKN